VPINLGHGSCGSNVCIDNYFGHFSELAKLSESLDKPFSVSLFVADGAVGEALLDRELLKQSMKSVPSMNLKKGREEKTGKP
jgi:hypothetical protein